MEKLRTEVKILSKSLDRVSGLSASAEATEIMDNKRIDQFKAYQEGKPTNAS